MTISLEKLRAVRHIVTHKDCADGIASAMVLRNVLGRVPVTFLQHNTEEHQQLKAEEGMLFCDFVPPKERVQEFIDVGALVLDHHKKAQDLVESFGENGVFADEEKEPGVSGAVLAYREVWARGDELWGLSINDRREAMEKFVSLVGIRDTWQTQHSHWLDACEISEALHFYPIERLFSSKLPQPEDWLNLQETGYILFDKKTQRAKESAEKSFRFKTLKGTRVAMFQGLTETSDAAEFLGEEVDIVVGFRYDITPPDGIDLIFSTRSHTGYDVGAFCKANGGGGHTAAAGFRLPQTKEDLTPFIEFKVVLGMYERGVGA